MNNISRLEVVHSPTPETPGSALAGSVNMTPRSAFERSRPVVTFSAFLMMRDNDRHLFSKTPAPRWTRTRKVHPGFEFSYLKPVNDRFGFTLTGSNTRQYTEEARTQNTWRGGGSATNGITAATAATQYPDTTPDRPYLSDYVVEDGGKTTMRTSAAGTLDYRLSRHDRLSLAMELTFYHSPLNQRTMSFFVNRVSPGDFTPTSTRGQVGRGEVRQTSQSRDHYRVKHMPTLVYRHDGPIWKAEAGTAWARERLHFRSSDQGFFNQVVSTRQNVTVAFDDIFYLRPGRITVADGTTGAPVDSVPTSTATRSARPAPTRSTTRTPAHRLRQRAPRLRPRRVPFTLKAGLDVRQSRRDDRTTNRRTRLSAPTASRQHHADRRGATTAPARARRGVLAAQCRRTGFRASSGSATRRARSPQGPPAWFVLDENAIYRSQSRTRNWAEETVSVRLPARRRRASSTAASSSSAACAPSRPTSTAQGRSPIRRATSSATPPAIASSQRQRPARCRSPPMRSRVSQLTFLDRGLRVEKEYLRLFPSLNASFNLRENLIARAAWYTSVGRPNFNQYAGGITLPDLEAPPATPTASPSTTPASRPGAPGPPRCGLEYYFEGVGPDLGRRLPPRLRELLRLDHLHAATPEFLALYEPRPAVYGRFDVSTQDNLPGRVRMTGVDVSYKQALTFLPPGRAACRSSPTAARSARPANDHGQLRRLRSRAVAAGASASRARNTTCAPTGTTAAASAADPATGRSLEPGTFNWGSKRSSSTCRANTSCAAAFAVFANLRNVGDATDDVEDLRPLTPERARFRQRTTYGSLWTVLGVFSVRCCAGASGFDVLTPPGIAPRPDVVARHLAVAMRHQRHLCLNRAAETMALRPQAAPAATVFSTLGISDRPGVEPALVLRAQRGHAGPFDGPSDRGKLAPG
jgi:iron complex outermembrane receptor protein